MNALPRIAALTSLVASLAACQATTEKPAASPVTTRVSGGLPQPRFEDDLEYIAYVERVARRRGLILQWVNKPQKRVVENP